MIFAGQETSIRVSKRLPGVGVWVCRSAGVRVVKAILTTCTIIVQCSTSTICGSGELVLQYRKYELKFYVCPGNINCNLSRI